MPTRMAYERRSPDLDRTGGPGPQPGQDRAPGRVIGTGPKIDKLGRECPPVSLTGLGLLQVKVA